ncbi:putative ribonuclease H-like domain-containing protein [Tanacetum coccineum]
MISIGQTATASTFADGTLELRATIDTIEYTITEAYVRHKLQLVDASRISMLPNTEIFEGIGNMGYPADEGVYVCQPPGFEDPQFPDKVYKVEKALYGLHQAPKAWCMLMISSLGPQRRLQVQQKKDGIFISQDKYVVNILKKFDFITVKTASIPMEPNKALIKDKEADSVDVHLYRLMIGSLMYLIASRPDITFAVCTYARDSPFDLEAFSDSDYAGASLGRKSTIGGCQFLGKRLISWQCKKQTIIANSTTQAEYVATANCCGQVLWIQNQMLDYGFNFMNTKIYIDNESTICIMKNLVFHSKTKHIEIRHHFIRDSYEKKLIQVIKIHTDHNVADLLTKAFDVSSAADYTSWMLRMESKSCQVMKIGLELKDKKELAIPWQTTTGKEFSNPLMAGSFTKTISEKVSTASTNLVLLA